MPPAGTKTGTKRSSAKSSTQRNMRGNQNNPQLTKAWATHQKSFQDAQKSFNQLNKLMGGGNTRGASKTASRGSTKRSSANSNLND